ncbi:hypothetical protein HPB50_025137 [Hyalomma asiaticum]|uniref:Uncharacterized protein n=1 Tax=Hyalomma asiaticum TaxID=266040 RepID=A0ACB7RSM1_HYAAI|nr:hypothetical protein HPB50_025137 [Hyalomma asiaticum]
MPVQAEGVAIALAIASNPSVIVLTDSQNACRNFNNGLIHNLALSVLTNHPPIHASVICFSGHQLLPGVNEVAHIGRKDFSRSWRYRFGSSAVAGLGLNRWADGQAACALHFARIYQSVPSVELEDIAWSPTACLVVPSSFLVQRGGTSFQPRDIFQRKTSKSSSHGFAIARTRRCWMTVHALAAGGWWCVFQCVYGETADATPFRRPAALSFELYRNKDDHRIPLACGGGLSVQAGAYSLKVTTAGRTTDLTWSLTSFFDDDSTVVHSFSDGWPVGDSVARITAASGFARPG